MPEAADGHVASVRAGSDRSDGNSQHAMPCYKRMCKENTARSSSTAVAAEVFDI